MAKEIKEKKMEELLKDLSEKRESLRVIKSNVGTKNKNVKEQGSIKKDIARILTEINARVRA